MSKFNAVLGKNMFDLLDALFLFVVSASMMRATPRSVSFVSDSFEILRIGPCNFLYRTINIVVWHVVALGLLDYRS